MNLKAILGSALALVMVGWTQPSSAQAQADDFLDLVTTIVSAYQGARTPQVSLIATPTQVSTGATVTLDATVKVGVGTVTGVQMFQDSTAIGPATYDTRTSKWTLAWRPTAGGTFSITARATTNRGFTGTSAPVVVQVCGAPTVTLTSSASTVALGANVAFTANATSSGGCSITRVEFYEGSTLVGSAVGSPPYAYSWKPSVAGTYSIKARAYDNRTPAVWTDSAPVSVSWCGLPTISLTSPTPGQSVASPVSFSATASSTTGCGISKVEFFDGTTSLFVDTNSPYQYSWSASLGSHTVKAVATDVVNQTAIAQAAITVQSANLPPTGSVTPSSITVVSGTASVPFVATGTDPEGSNLTFDLIYAGNIVATSTQPSGSAVTLSWTPPTNPGSYALTLRITDAGGNSVNTAINVVVTPPRPVSAVPNGDAVIDPAYVTPTIGTLPGTFNVTDSGAAAYGIPIHVPPGVAGLQPNLALSYSSQGGYGSLGVGWSLSGLSTIARCPKTEAQDGTREGINYNGNAYDDAFCLDGQRLLAVAGPTFETDYNYSTTGTAAEKYEYRTEVDGIARIESWQEQSPAALYGPYRFRVWHKSGLVADYGSRFWIMTAGHTQGFNRNGSFASRVNVAKVWVLDRVSDRAGNFMEIDYADRIFEINPLDPAGINVVRLPSNCTLPTNGGFRALNTPIGALPSVEYWPTAIRYYSRDASPSACGDSPNNQVLFAYEDIPSQASIPSRDRYFDSGAGQSRISRRLRSIETRADGFGDAPGQLAARYDLRYVDSPQTGRSLLASIQQCGDDGACLPATQFTWAAQDTGPGGWINGRKFAVQGLAVAPSISVDRFGHDNNGVYVADWNGDGKSDLIGWLHSIPGGSPTFKHDLVVCIASNDAGGFRFICDTANPLYSYRDEIRAVDDPSSARVVVMDLNNDGRADAAISRAGETDWIVRLSNGSGGYTTSPYLWRTVTQGYNNYTFHGDIDGDGRIDVVTYDVMGSPGITMETCLTRDTGFLCTKQDLRVTPPNCPATDPGCEEFDGNSHSEVLVADVNGDGRADLILRKSANNGENKWKVCFSDFGPGRSGTYRCHDRFVQGPSATASNTVLFDFNGDGIADMASPNGTSNDGTWLVCLSTGDGAFEMRDPYIRWDPFYNNGEGRWIDSGGNGIDYYDSTRWPRCRIWHGTTGIDTSANAKTVYGDFNGDGRTDLAAWDRALGRWRVCLSTGSEFTCENWAGPNIPISDPDLNQWLVSGDFNGDGKTDMLVFDPSGPAQLALASGAPTGDVVTRITTGLAATTTVGYAPLTDGSVYAKGTGANAQQRELDIQSPMYVVKQSSESNGLGGTFDTVYFYENLRGRTDGRGLYGFSKRRSRDGNGVVTEYEYYRVSASAYPQEWAKVGRPSMVRKYAPLAETYVADIANVTAFTGSATLFNGAMQLVNRSSTTWTMAASKSCGGPCVGSPGPVVVTVNNSVDESFELTGTALHSTTTSYGSYSDFASPTSVAVGTSDGFVKSVQNTYSSDVSLWLVDRLQTAASTNAATGTSTISRNVAYTYEGFGGGSCSAPRGHLCSETVEPGSDPLITQYQYDAYGNRSAITIAFTDRGTPVVRTASTQFGQNGRFPSLIVNAVDHRESRIYDTRWGSVKQRIDPNGIRTDALVDGFGRKYGERTYDPSGNRLGESFAPIEIAGLRAPYERYRVRKLASGGGESHAYFDELQRELRSTARAFNDSAWAESTVSYDAKGRRATTTKPVASTTGVITTSFTYDVLNRVKTEQVDGASLTLLSTYAYGAAASVAIDGTIYPVLATTKVTQAGTGIVARDTIRYVTSQGKTARIVDGESGITDFRYDGVGNLRKVIGPNGIVESVNFDSRGRKTDMTNPDSGSWTYAYNAAGELTRQADANGQVTVLYYDKLGRVVERREHEGTEANIAHVTISTFDTCLNGRGKPCAVSTGRETRGAATQPPTAIASPTTQKVMSYDQASRQEGQTTTVDGTVYTSYVTFDANSRVDKRGFPSGYIQVHRYKTWSGQLDQIADWTISGGTGTVQWQADSRFVDGQLQQFRLAGGTITTTRTYDGFGRPRTIATPGIQSATYAFDALGNLTSRVGPETADAAQSFVYDRLSRLTVDRGSPIQYYADGRIQARGGAGYTYSPAASHRLASGAGSSYTYDLNGNAKTAGAFSARTIAYTPFNLPTSISQGAVTLTYVYDEAHARIKETSTDRTGSTTTYYLGGYEERVLPSKVVEQRHYIGTPDGAVGLYTVRSDATVAIRYWHRDHLGSVAVMTDAAGVVKQKYGFDPWGNRSQQVMVDASPEERGFTGHEHLLEVGLVHMNGRIYDPAAGVFLQADPYVTDPFNGQNYNRYGYVLNNPLSMTDPSGFSFWTKWRRPIIAMVATVATYGATSWMLTAAAVEAGTSTSFATITLGNFGVEGATLTTAGQAVAGAAGGFAAGGIQGGNVESAVYGAFTGGVMGAVGGLVGDYSLPVRIGAKAAASAAFAYVHGSDWRRAARFAAFAELARAGWAYARDRTDTLYAASCTREANCSHDAFGKSTDGGRNIVRSITPEEMGRVSGPITSFLEGGMAMEGQPHMYTPSQPFCDAIGDALCGAVRGFVRQVSKPHDWGNSWSYDNDPSRPTYGYRIEGGGFNSLAARVGYEVSVQAWSLTTMPAMAGYTAFSLYGDYFNPYLYDVKRRP